ncbi:hypothetical protein SNEBB_008609 [Seison nebaliae]|nr:hypothetical protein SNEBB_008609 [Seison nebaliae]
MKGCSKKTILKHLRKELLLILTIIAVALGFAIGLGIRKYNLDEEVIYGLGFPGQIFLRMLQMIIVPLIVSSLITAIAGMDAGSFGKIGGIALGYYSVTTILAVIEGIIMVAIIRPGEKATDSIKGSSYEEVKVTVHTVDTIFDLIYNMIPTNVIESTFDSYKIERGYEDVRNETHDLVRRKLVGANVKIQHGTNILGVVSFCVLFGTILSRLDRNDPAVKIVIDFFDVLNRIIMRMVSLLMWFSPIGVFFLILNQVLIIDSISETFRALAIYMGTVIAALTIHAAIVLPLFVFFLTRMRRNPFRIMAQCTEAFATSFATDSSSATLPVTYKCVEENCHVDKRVSRFVLTIGATVNMNGTALYEAVASLFIAQLYGKHLSPADYITTALTSTLAAVGAAGIPQAGMVTMLIVLNTLGLPTEKLSLILTVDWLLDRIRTTINVWGDVSGTIVTYELTKSSLAPSDSNEELTESTMDEDEKLNNGNSLDYGKNNKNKLIWSPNDVEMNGNLTNPAYYSSDNEETVTNF